MAIRKPIVSVIGPSGRNLVPIWGRSLLGITITDQAGYESDEAVLRFSAPPFDPPKKGTRYQVKVGWAADALALTGIYSVSRTRFGGDPETGERMEVVCRAADFLDKMKAIASAHYDKENGFGTAGSIFRALAEEAGVPAVIASSIDGIEVPYRLRWNQSPLDFATDLADEVGAIVKPQAGRMVILERGAGKSASGKELPEIRIDHDPTYSWEAEIEERSSYGKVEATWFDDKKGRPQTETAETGREAGKDAPMHVSPSKTDAKKGAAARAQQLSRYTGTATFETVGRPEAVAGAPVVPSGYGSTIDAIKWEASGITHEIAPEEGWITTVEAETKETTK
ncbi:contractile injection system protein, VgrG/Pvc8 family [Breoghania sp.]|uniref:phage late control D family protein n=1 Tax=Breoghania sp. TaxID=2065378 RepID=UPI0029C9DCF5|nr:contractile injection system protein, VgrG/Pvc8 family [Breoghania sp.]